MSTNSKMSIAVDKYSDDSSVNPDMFINEIDTWIAYNAVTANQQQVMASDRQQQTTTTSTKPRSRNRHATDSTTSQSSDAGSANRRSERLRHAQQRTATVNTLAMHMLQLYITQ